MELDSVVVDTEKEKKEEKEESSDDQPRDWRVYAKLAATHFHLTNHPTIYCLAFPKLRDKLVGNFAQVRKETLKGGAVKNFLFLIVVLALPWIYANSLMEVPCDKSDQAIYGKKNGTSVEVVEVAAPDEECVVEFFLRSPESLVIGPLTFIAVFVIVILSTPLFSVVTACMGQEIRTLFVPGSPIWIAQRLYHMRFRPMFVKLSYNVNSEVEADPVHYIRTGFLFFNLPIVFVMAYFILLGEFVVIAILHGNTFIGFIIGFGIAEVFASASNTLVGQSDDIIRIVNGKLAELGDPYEALLEHDSGTIALTTEDLDQIAADYPFEEKNAVKAPEDMPEDDDYWLKYMMQVSLLKKVYLTDTEEYVTFATELKNSKART